VASLRKLRKKAGHDEVVKLLPRLESKGCGSAVGADGEESTVAAAAPAEVRRVSVAWVAKVVEDEEGFARGKRWA